MEANKLSEKIQSLDAKALAELLKEIKLYSNLKKQLGKRGVDQYKRNLKAETLLVVEYYSEVGEDLAWEQAQKIYKKAFGQDIDRSDVQIIKKDSLKGGIKVYYDDSMVDMSFAKIELSLNK